MADNQPQHAEDVAPEGFEFDRVETVADAVFQALGAASMCWEHPYNGGVFDSTRAKAIGDALIRKLVELETHSDGQADG